LLTAFGVFWGIFMLMLLLGAGKGMQNGVHNEFGSDVLDFIIVVPGVTSVPYQGLGIGRNVRFDDSDVDAVRRQSSDVSMVSMDRTVGLGLITYADKNGSFDIHGIPDEYFKIKSDVPFNFGRKLNPLDEHQIRKIVVIGTHVAERVFPAEVDPIGKDLRVKGVILKVAGVFHDKFSREQFSDRIYIPESTFNKMYGPGNSAGLLWVRMQPGVDVEAAETHILELLRRRHDVANDDRRGIRSFNVAKEAKKVDGLFIGIDVFIWFVGMGTLMAGIVGVSNIMIITVKERTKEIGIRKALGATPFSIVSTLLMESVLVTGVAGYTGMVLGVGLMELISMGIAKSGAKLPYFANPEIDFHIALIAIALLIVVGVLAGLMPALRAAKITPTEAMRAD
jgi:putative ABC transport system permease protein